MALMGGGGLARADGAWRILDGMSDDLTFVSPSGVMAMRVIPGLLVQTITGKPTREDFVYVAERGFTHPALGERFVQICRVAPDSVRDTPDDDFRKTAAEYVERQHGKLQGFGYVVVGSPLLSATARAVISGISLLSRAPHPEKAFGDLEDAARWLHGLRPEGPGPQQMIDAVEELLRVSAKVRERQT
jgi:hypothetical protein